MQHDRQAVQSHRLIVIGIVLFLLGLVTGLLPGTMANPRMGLSSHLVGLTNGMFLILIGLVWLRLRLGGFLLTLAFWLAVLGAMANWLTTLLAGYWGAGASMMPIAAGGFEGLAWQESAISIGLLMVVAATVLSCLITLWGLRHGGATKQ